LNFKSYSNLTHDINSALPWLQEEDFDLIVGIPRSGMIPAYVIGLNLNILVTDLQSYIDNRSLSSGITRSPKKRVATCWEANKVLLVDDSVLSGESIKVCLSQLPEHLVKRVKTLVVYGHSSRYDYIDKVVCQLSAPRVFEWNVFHRAMLANTCVDIDGVLCVDPTEEVNDDGPKYMHFLKTAKPMFIPSYRIHSLVTNRLEKYRTVTEDWLNTHGVVYDNLIMLGLDTASDRLGQHDYFAHKSNYYKSQNFDLFIESSEVQSYHISKRTGKPVYCVDTNTLFKNDSSMSMLKNPSSLKRRLRLELSKYLPSFIKDFIKIVSRRK
jgi:uncharacterized HAD superfamily protein